MPLSVGTNDVGFITLEYESAYAEATPLGPPSAFLLHTSGGSQFRDQRERVAAPRLPGHGPREHDTRRKRAGGPLTFEVEYDAGMLRGFDMHAGGRSSQGGAPLFDHYLWPEVAKPTAKLTRYLGRHLGPNPGAKNMRQTLAMRDGDNLTVEWDFMTAYAADLEANSAFAPRTTGYTNVKQSHIEKVDIGNHAYTKKVYAISIVSNENPGRDRFGLGATGRAEPFRGTQGIGTRITMTVDADADWLSDDGTTGTYKELFIDEATAEFRIRFVDVVAAPTRQIIFYSAAAAMVGDPIEWAEGGEQLAQIVLECEDGNIDFTNSALFPVLGAGGTPPAAIIRPWAMLISNSEDASGFPAP